MFTVLPTDAQILQQELIAFPLRQFLCMRKERKEESKGGPLLSFSGANWQKKAEKKKKKQNSDELLAMSLYKKTWCIVYTTVSF